MISARGGRARTYWILAVALVIPVGYAADAWNRSRVASMRAPASPPSPHLAGLARDPATLVRAFGEPDYDQSAIESDSSITRRITYAVEYVQVIYRTDGSASAPTAGPTWKLIGFRDPASHALLDPAEAMQRLDARKR